MATLMLVFFTGFLGGAESAWGQGTTDHFLKGKCEIYVKPFLREEKLAYENPALPYLSCRGEGIRLGGRVVWTPEGNPLGTCVVIETKLVNVPRAGGGTEPKNVTQPSKTYQNITYQGCQNFSLQTLSTDITRIEATWSPPGIAPLINQTTATTNPNSVGAAIVKNCGITALDWCILGIFKVLFNDIPSILLAIAAWFFNFLLTYSLGTGFFEGAFVGTAWGTVRDLSNIFFILILLYVGIKTIIGLGGHDSQKIIVSVVMMALLINFSMFFTKIVIDSSNMLALVFYNRISSIDKKTNKEVFDKFGNKDLAAGLTESFNPVTKLDGNFFASLGNFSLPDGRTVQELPAVSTLIGVVLVSGAIILYATYALMAVAIYFLGRYVELAVLLIFSPFAFMSWALPMLSHKEYIGWDAWLKRLFEVAFMAPIFMFFLYFIFLLLDSNMFVDSIRATGIAALINLMIPAFIILILLMKAKDFAKKGAGQAGEAIMSGAKLAGGLALGAATGGTAIAGRATLGRAGAAFANSATAKKWEAKGWGGEYARRAATAVGSGSFDIRGVKVAGKSLASTTGMHVGEAQKGGFVERRKERVENRQKRAKELEVGEDETLTQDLHKLENDLQELRAVGSHEITEIDKRIEGAIKANKAAQASLNAEDAEKGTPGTPGYVPASAGYAAAKTKAKETADRVNDLRKQRGSIKNATGTTTNTADLTADLATRRALAAGLTAGSDEAAQAAADIHAITVALNVAAKAASLGNRSMNNFEDTIIPEAHHKIENESRNRKRTYANTVESPLGRVKDFLLSGGQSSYKESKEAAHKIRMGAKIEEGKGGGGDHH